MQPTFLAPLEIAPDVYALRGLLPVFDLGVLPINSFLIRGEEPLLVDTGAPPFREAFIESLRTLIDPRDLRWVWISHADRDHTGNLQAVLDLAPQARLVTSFLSAGKLQFGGTDVRDPKIIGPGEAIVLGDLNLQVLRPPYYDAPETVGFFEKTRRLLYGVDLFGALVESVSITEPLDAGTLRRGMLAWAEVDAPILGMLDEARLREIVQRLEALEPKVLLAAHAPEAQPSIAKLGGLLMDVFRTLRTQRREEFAALEHWND